MSDPKPRDPLIAQKEEAADAEQDARTANLFDVRRAIGALFVIYGLILTVLGLFASDADIEKAAGQNVNLWAGLAILAVGAGFLFWAITRPVTAEELAADAEEAAGAGGGGEPDGPAPGARAA